MLQAGLNSVLCEHIGRTAIISRLEKLLLGGNDVWAKNGVQ